MKITPKSTKVVILGAIFGPIWIPLSQGGGSFLRPGSRNLLKGHPWSDLGLPGATPGAILLPFWMVLDGFGLHLAPKMVQDRSRRLSTGCISISVSASIYTTLFAMNLPKTMPRTMPRTRQEHNKTQTPTAKHQDSKRGAAVSPRKGEFN